MPELPEVQTIVSTLQPVVVGTAIKKVELFRREIVHLEKSTAAEPFDLAAQLVGRQITALTRRGKRIIFTLKDGAQFYIHLGMTGRLIAQHKPIEPVKHTHLRLMLSNGKLLDFIDPRRFGGVWWLGQDARPDGDLGPEPLTLRSAELYQSLAKTHRAVKSALLDQHVIAGLGNIYVDEALFAASIHPATLSDTLSLEQTAALLRAIKSTLNSAIKHRGSSVHDYRDGNNEAGVFQTLHKVYNRKGQPCLRCGTPLQRIVLGGRGTCFCPKCQPEPNS